MINEKSNDILGKLIVSSDYFFIDYSQMMGNKYIKFGRYKRYQIKRGLTLPEKRQLPWRYSLLSRRSSNHYRRIGFGPTSQIADIVRRILFRT
jgi:hypothetical protein